MVKPDPGYSWEGETGGCVPVSGMKIQRDVQVRQRMLRPLVIYAHCCSHLLNIVVFGASQLTSIRNVMVIFASIYDFISGSVQLAAVLISDKLL